MSISSRQSELFAGEVWTVLYQAFTSINFNASDPTSINQALQSYIQTNYPENFNDWIVQSEFIAIIDLLSWLAGTLAYKTDLMVRENFIDTAEARTSILRLARFLSYNPSRNQCASGILKITQVSTNDNVFDSFGSDLSGITINWNDPNNSNWLEQFTTILNAAFISTNPYGIPLKAGSIAGVNVQLYRVNGFYANNTFSFSSTISGVPTNFEIANGDFNNNSSLIELTPNPNNGFQFYYLSDGNGNGSAQTGFFTLFKQGTTVSDTFTIGTPVENQILTLSSTNINNTDVWVQTVNDDGSVSLTWTQVPVMLDSNITYNNLPNDQKNIYSLITLDNDGVNVRFSDGLYGYAPTGNIKVTYRVSNGLAYSIQPQEITGVTLNFNYINRNGATKTLTLTLSLQQTISNAVPAETIEQIRYRAPQVYQTQNRMVSGEDYNSFPLQANIALKLKAVNRIYSGQSRYIDLNDPTGTYQDLAIFADDAILFKEETDTYTEVPIYLGYSPTELINSYIQPNLSSEQMYNAFLNAMLTASQNNLLPPVPQGMVWIQSNSSLFTNTGYFQITNGTTALIQPGAMIKFAYNYVPVWVGVVSGNSSNFTTEPPQNTAGPVTLTSTIPSGAVVLEIIPAFNYELNSTITAQIQNAITTSQSFSLQYDYTVLPSNGVPNNWYFSAGGVSALGSADVASLTPPGSRIIMLIANYFSGGNYIAGGTSTTAIWQITSRGLSYVFESATTIEWFDNGQRAIDQQTGLASNDLVHVLPINQNLNDPRGYALIFNYDFSIGDIWLYPNGYPEPRRTYVNFADSLDIGFPTKPDSFLNIVSKDEQQAYLFWSTTPPNPAVATSSNVYPYYSMTVFDTQQNLINSTPTNSLGNWDAFNNVPPLESSNGGSSGSYYTVTNPGNTNLNGNSIWAVGDIVVFNGVCWVKAPISGSEAFVVSGNTVYDNTSFTDNSFWTYIGTAPTGTWVQDTSTNFAYAIGRGGNVAKVWNTSFGSYFPNASPLSIEWKHYAPSTSRIDPSSQNIIDIFVLTFDYDTAVRTWIANGADPTSVPSPPTELDLRIAYENMENYRMFSDAIIWRPVKYKYLFGPNSDPGVQMNFKVVRIPNATVSNGLIQSNVINAINTYFDASYWDFGETFYWSELCAYIHQQLAGQIASIVPVPVAADAYFGDGFEISSQPDEIFVSTAQVSNVVIIDSNTPVNLRIY